MKPCHQCLVIALLLFGSSESFSRQLIDAEQFDLADYRGRVVYLDFWASWCTPCRASFPFMAEMAESQGDALAIVAVNVDEQRTDAEAFLNGYQVPFDVVFDPTGLLASRHQVPGMPTSYLFDRDGTLIGSHVGFRMKDRESIRRWVTDAIAN
ncbi:TlpA family protein disulfide reductase [Granulosicoccus sp. 3-233]|uniref:TlpA family protein disulfide reductase n=1 Tax=Granulosicoccus sp. 3-233 TaxID=3417969 RepID=UPI003D332225